MIAVIGVRLEILKKMFFIQSKDNFKSFPISEHKNNRYQSKSQRKYNEKKHFKFRKFLNEFRLHKDPQPTPKFSGRYSIQNHSEFFTFLFLYYSIFSLFHN